MKELKINLRTDFQNVNSGEHIILYPNNLNPLHKNPISAVFRSGRVGGYFYPDYGTGYNMENVQKLNHGYTKI